MNDGLKKPIKLSIIINSVTAACSILYLIITVVIIVLCIGLSVASPGGYTGQGLAIFLTALILPIGLFFAVFPITRITALICSIASSDRLHNGKNPKGTMIMSGVLQILDALGSWCFLGIIIFTATRPGIVLKALEAIGATVPDPLLNSLSSVLFFICSIPLMAKTALQIISSVKLFNATKNYKEVSAGYWERR